MALTKQNKATAYKSGRAGKGKAMAGRGGKADKGKATADKSGKAGKGKAMAGRGGKAGKGKATADKSGGGGNGKATVDTSGQGGKGKSKDGEGVEEAGKGKATVDTSGKVDKGKSKDGEGAEEDDEISMHEGEDSESDMEDDDDDSVDERFYDTRLHLARTARDVVELIAEGIDVNSEDSLGMTPLHVAGSVEVAEALLDNKAKINYWASEPIDYEWADENDSGTPLRREHIALLLIKRGAELSNDQDSKGNTALANHVRWNNFSVVEEMIRKKPGLVVDADDIICATEEDDDKLLRLLLSVNGAGKNPGGRTALHNARKRLKLLLEFGADVNARDRDGDSPLHTNISDEVSLLIDHGANIEAVNNEGETPLHVACKHVDRPQWDKKRLFLLNAGASTRARRKNGQTPGDLLLRATTPLPGPLAALLRGGCLGV